MSLIFLAIPMSEGLSVDLLTGRRCTALHYNCCDMKPPRVKIVLCVSKFTNMNNEVVIFHFYKRKLIKFHQKHQFVLKS